MVAAAGIAKLLFYLFLVLFLVSLISGLASGRRFSNLDPAALSELRRKYGSRTC
jgi:hypothetical protein